MESVLIIVNKKEVYIKEGLLKLFNTFKEYLYILKYRNEY